MIDLAVMLPAEARQTFEKLHPGVWAQRRLGYVNERHHWEWYEFQMLHSRCAVCAPRESAKALSLDTLVVTPSGHVPLRDIQVGDMVESATGPTRVTRVSAVFSDHDCYRVSLSDGQSFVADGGHQWLTYYAWRGSRVVTTKQMKADVDIKERRGQTHVIDCRPSTFGCEPSFDPYLLGVWLGDGSSAKAAITTADPEIIRAFEDAGLKTSYRSKRGKGKAETVGFSAGWDRSRSFCSTLRRLGVFGNKHVPREFLWADRKSRMALLQGLCDSDGSCASNGEVQFVSTRAVLAEAVAHLVWSLGWKPVRSEGRAKLYGKDCGPVFKVCWFPDEPVFRLQRKAVKQRLLPEGRRSKALGRAVRSVVRIPSVPVKCLTTESGTYLIGEGVVTHNSAVFSVISTAHKAVFTRGSWQYLFSASLDQSKLLLERVVSTIAAVEPWLLEGAPRFSSTDVILANWSRIQVASIGKSMRGIHPDRIVGDDVLDEDTSMTDYQRRKMTGWWFGSVGPMAHPGTMRPMQWGLLKPKGSSDIPMLRHPPTTITLAGTPFHQLDLLMSMRDNPVYAFRRYAAEFDPKELIPGTMALEATDIMRAA